MEHLTMQELNASERELYLQLKDVQARKKQVEIELDKELAAASAARREALAAAHAAMRELMVLGIPLDKLKTKAHDAGLKIVSVHPQVHEWLREALPSANGEHFSQLLSALVEMLIENRRQVRAVIEQMKESSDNQYFQAGCEGEKLYVITDGVKHTVIADYLAAFAIEWRKQEEQK